MREGLDRELWLVVTGVVSLLASCSSGSGNHESEGLVPVRLSPVRVENADAASDASAWLLFDRDTRAGWSPAIVETGGSARVSVALGETTTITHLKVFGASRHVLGVRAADGSRIKGLEQVRLDGLGAGWNVLSMPEGTSL